VASEEHPDASQADGASVSSDEDEAQTERRSVSTEIGDVSFPTSVRGYERGAVDAHLSRVQQLIAELETTRSPEAAIKHALAQVGEQTKGILERAGETAEQITVAARQEADEHTGRARGEAKDLVAKTKAEADEILGRSNAEAEATVAQARKEAAEHLQRTHDEITALRQEAEARRQELQADTEAIRKERTRLLNDIREVATRVKEIAMAADTRFPPPPGREQVLPDEPQHGAEAEPDASGLTATDSPTAEATSRRRSPG
jgi:DivIVA domain-containing protein